MLPAGIKEYQGFVALKVVTNSSILHFVLAAFILFWSNQVIGCCWTKFQLVHLSTTSPQTVSLLLKRSFLAPQWLYRPCSKSTLESLLLSWFLLLVFLLVFIAQKYVLPLLPLQFRHPCPCHQPAVSFEGSVSTRDVLILDLELLLLPQYRSHSYLLGLWTVKGSNCEWSTSIESRASNTGFWITTTCIQSIDLLDLIYLTWIHSKLLVVLAKDGR